MDAVSRVAAVELLQGPQHPPLPPQPAEFIIIFNFSVCFRFIKGIRLRAWAANISQNHVKFIRFFFFLI